VDVADLPSGAAGAFAGGLLGALDQAGVGSEVADRGEAPDVVDLVEDDQGKRLADAWDGLQQMQGVGVVLTSCPQEEALQ
jgi:hypothetical protein